MSGETLLFLIALAAERGADVALSQAIETGFLSPDQHIQSDDYLEAVDEAKEF